MVEAVLVVLAVLVLVLAVGLLRGAGRSSRASRSRNRRALEGESYAEQLLQDEGYCIEDRQVMGSWCMWNNGEAEEVSVRADLLVSKRGRSFIAEVKTGRLAPDPCFPATRRQLLEYQMVFDVDGVLLVDVEDGLVLTVEFPCQRTDL